LIGVVLAIYLAEIGLSSTTIGMVIGSGLAGAAVATLPVGSRGDAFGRRRALVALALLSTLGYGALAVADHAPLLTPFAFGGMLNGMGRDRGAASAPEQAMLPATTSDQGRTWSLAWYNVVLDTGHAVGALAGAAPTVFARLFHVGSISAHRLAFLLCAGAMRGGLDALPFSDAP
jgi:MFS family permease